MLVFWLLRGPDGSGRIMTNLKLAHSVPPFSSQGISFTAGVHENNNRIIRLYRTAAIVWLL